MFIYVIDLFTESYISSDEFVSHGDDGKKPLKYLIKGYSYKY